MSKQKYKESALPSTEFLELKLIYLDREEAFNMLINYLFDLELDAVRNPKVKQGVIYKPGFYMEYYKPDLELKLERETDKMYITIRGFDGNRRILMNPEFMKRLNNPELSNNIYDKAILKRVLIEKCINNLREKLRAILFYFLNPNNTLESLGISKSVASEIYLNKQRTRTTNLIKAVNILIKEIINVQEGLT